MTEQQTATTPAPATVADLESMSHADYRATREGRTTSEAKPAEKPEPKSSADPETGSTSEPESETGNDEQENQPTDPPKKGGFQKRIDRLTKEKAELERQLAEKTAAKPEEKQPEKKQAAAAAEKPQVQNFETYEDFVEALTDWKASERDKAREAAAAKATREAEQQKAAEKWQGQLDAAREKYDDFDTVALSNAAISPAMHNAIVGSDQGAELAYYLGQNPAERERIRALAPVAAMIEMGKIAAKLDAGNTPEEKTKNVSAAPPPIKPLGAKNTTASRKLEDMSHAEYRKARESGRI